MDFGSAFSVDLCALMELIKIDWNRFIVTSLVCLCATTLLTCAAGNVACFWNYFVDVPSEHYLQYRLAMDEKKRKSCRNHRDYFWFYLFWAAIVQRQHDGSNKRDKLLTHLENLSLWLIIIPFLCISLINQEIVKMNTLSTTSKFNKWLDLKRQSLTNSSRYNGLNDFRNENLNKIKTAKWHTLLIKTRECEK